VLYSLGAARLQTRRVRRRRLLLSFAAAAALLLVVAAIAPSLVARIVAGRLSSSLGTPVHVGRLSWNPLRGTWTLQAVRVQADHGAPAFSVRRLTATVFLFDLLRGRHRLRNLVLVVPRFRLRATPTGWELPLQPAPSQGDGSAAWPTLVLDGAQVTQAAVRLERPGRASTLRLRRAELMGATDPDGLRVRFWSKGRLDRGSISCDGRLRLAHRSRRLRVRVATDRLDLRRVLGVVERQGLPDLTGQVALHATYDQSDHGTHGHGRVRGRLTGQALALRANGNERLRAQSVRTSRFMVDLERRHAELDDLRVTGANVTISRRGTIVEIPGIFRSDSPPSGSPAWTVTITDTVLQQVALHHTDASTGEAAPGLLIEEGQLGALGAPEVSVPFSFTATIDSGGHLDARGELGPGSAAGSARLSLTEVALPPFVHLVGGPVELESGVATGTLDITLRDGVGHGSGTVTLGDLKTRSPDPDRPENVLACHEIRLTFNHLRTSPFRMAFTELRLASPYLFIDRAPSGVFPLTVLFPAETSGTQSADSSGLDAAIRIDRLAVSDGRIDFRDLMLTPPYWRSLAAFELGATDVALPRVRIARFEGKGLVDELSPLRFAGTVGADRTEVTVNVERLALPPFNAYLQSAADYAVSSGAVSVQSQIVLDRSALEVNNQVVLSRLGIRGTDQDDFVQRQLGIPLTIALTLMKDYRGDVALNVPFGGDLHSPSFSLRTVIVQAILQAIRGAVMSPLNAIGRVILHDGRIEQFDLAPIPFPPGSATLDPGGHERVAQIAHVLALRPDLAIRLAGTVGDADLQRLTDEAALETLGTERRDRALRTMLQARLAGQPVPRLEAADQTRLDALRASLPWPGEALRNLAQDRGSAAAAVFIGDFNIPPARVAVDASPTPTPGPLPAAGGVTVNLGAPGREALRGDGS
jgi:Domain of Unknown Function (DUF748)